MRRLLVLNIWGDDGYSKSTAQGSFADVHRVWLKVLKFPTFGIEQKEAFARLGTGEVLCLKLAVQFEQSKKNPRPRARLFSELKYQISNFLQKTHISKPVNKPRGHSKVPPYTSKARSPPRSCYVVATLIGWLADWN